MVEERFGNVTWDPLKNEGVNMPNELSHWVVLSSLQFKVEKDTPFLKVLKASFLCLKDMPITAVI